MENWQLFVQTDRQTDKVTSSSPVTAVYVVTDITLKLRG